MIEIINIYGPPATGKTLNAHAAAEFFKCHTTDGAIHKGPRHLMTSLEPWKGARATVTNISVEYLKEILGEKWIEPDPDFYEKQKLSPFKREAFKNELGQVIGYIVNGRISGTLATYCTFNGTSSLFIPSGEDHDKAIARLQKDVAKIDLTPVEVISQKERQVEKWERSFNINHNVKVRLSDIGKKLQPFPREEDENGFTAWQMWELMATFGSCISMCKQPPFETVIFFREEDLEVTHISAHGSTTVATKN